VSLLSHLHGGISSLLSRGAGGKSQFGKHGEGSELDLRGGFRGELGGISWDDHFLDGWVRGLGPGWCERCHGYCLMWLLWRSKFVCCVIVESRLLWIRSVENRFTFLIKDYLGRLLLSGRRKKSWGVSGA
jgi:hypothetical protein